MVGQTMDELELLLRTSLEFAQVGSFNWRVFMHQLIYSRKLTFTESIIEFIKEAFPATPLGIFVAALRQRA